MMKYGALALGFLVWFSVSLISGRSEAWDSGLYWVAGLPVLAIAAIVMGYLSPERPALCGVWLAAGQIAGMAVFGMVHGKDLGLLPFAAIAIAVVSLPLVALSAIAGFVRRRFGARF